jgi:hypothetical protein
MQKNKTRTIYQIKTLFIVLIVFCSLAVLNISFAQNFIGPSCAAGQCQGKIGVDSSGNMSIGTSTPQSGTKTLIISQTSDSSSYGLRVLSSNNSPLLLVRSDGKISIATSGASYALNVSGDIYASGNLVVGGTFSAPIPAGNVTPGVFNSLQGGGTGAYAFLGSLGIATSSQVGLPQSLSVYGGGYFSGNVGIGTTGPGYKLDVNGNSRLLANNYGGVTLEQLGYPNQGALIFSTDRTGYTFQIGNRRLSDSNYLPIISMYDSGNVGIGTTTPAYKLDVAGQVNSSGGLCIAGDCKTSWSQVGGSSQWTNTTGGIYYLGNVGIGTSAVSYPLFVSTSTDTLFAIQRTGASSPTIFKQGTDAGFVINNGGSDILTIKSGNVGIGTTSPATILDIGGGTNYINTNLTYQMVPTTAKTIQVRDASNAVVNLVSDANTNGAILGAMMFSRSGGQADAHYNVAGIQATEVGTGILAGANLNFYTKPDGAGFTAPRMTIDSSGNVGIGTTTPAQKLDVNGYIRVQSINGEGGTIQLDGNNGTKIFVANINGDFRLVNSPWTTELFRVTQSGNVGIGTTSPAYKLDVASGGSVTARFGTASSDTVVIGGGAGKLTVGTVDPVYSISGKKYATYGPESIGVKVSHTGVLKLVLNKNKYEGALDFKNTKEGDDLWLFSKTTNLASNFDKLTIQLTPAFKGKVWYSKDKENMIVKIYGEADELNNNELEISYSLSAPRFDFEKWTNYSNDETVEGIKINY